MPLCTLHLLRLSPGSTEQSLLERVTTSSSATNHQVILVSKPRGPVIRVSHDADRDRINGQWDLLLVLASSSTGSSGSKVQLLKDEEAFKSYIQDELVYPTGIPTRLLQTLPERSAQLQNDRGPALPYDIIGGRSSSSSSSTSDVVAPSRDSQNLELSEGLVDFAHKLLQDDANGGAGPVWMLNFLRFRQGEKDNYINYGKNFAEVAKRFGGTVVVVGSVVGPSSPSSSSSSSNNSSEPYWHEFALAHYPSIRHFVDMSADGSKGGYQEINRRWRLGSLDDTGIVCTTPIDLNRGGRRSAASRL